MNIESSSNTITITGNIKSIADFSQIKSKTDSLVILNKDIVVTIVNSLSITSSVIGYFNKIILKDGVNVQMRVGNDQLLSLIDDLNLVSTFNARKM
ncbi:MAG: hypothetical protein JJW00_09995 [Sulfurimonas sp.]|nr:hypothetical protein [Sulfurimonas sp.]